MDELEGPREDRKLTPSERDRAVDEVMGVVGEVDGFYRPKANPTRIISERLPARPSTEEEIDRAGDWLLRAVGSIFSAWSTPGFKRYSRAW